MSAGRGPPLHPNHFTRAHFYTRLPPTQAFNTPLPPQFRFWWWCCCCSIHPFPRVWGQESMFSRSIKRRVSVYFIGPMGMIYDQEIEKWSIYLILNLKTECLALELGVGGLLNKKNPVPPSSSCTSGLQKSFDVLQSWADPVSCSLSVDVMIFFNRRDKWCK